MTIKPDRTAVLAAWTALEALSPQTYKRTEDLADGERSRVVHFSTNRLPWAGSGEQARPGHQLFYQIILGSIVMNRATEDLVRAFGKDEELSIRSHEKSVIAAVLVDRNGVLVADKGIGVSSFAWALPLALKRELSQLGLWTQVEEEVIEKLTELLHRVDEDANPIPLDHATIVEVYQWLVSKFGLAAHLIEPPTFAVRKHQSLKTKDPPEVSLLNSFYLRDLAKAASLVQENAAPPALLRYLGIRAPGQTFDLLNDRAELQKAVAPAMMPAARWPSPGGHPLVLLQQAAVNLARAELAGREGIIAVNGPPGTGKTTLLRDIVAGCVLDRASAMVAFDDPDQAFIDSGENVAFSETVSAPLFKLADCLKGHEILVASSNNKAVENISKEMPALKAVGRSIEELNYFKSVSDNLFRAKQPGDSDDAPESKASEPIETWGLCAAVLGNSRNKNAFKQAFWWHAEYGFRHYLKAAKGDNVACDMKDPETGRVECRTPAIVLTEKPPTPLVARANWMKAKNRFKSLKREIDSDLAALEKIRQLCHQLNLYRQELERQERELQQLLEFRTQAQARFAWCQSNVASSKQGYERQVAVLQSHGKKPPGFIQHFFRTKRWLAWMAADAQLVANVAEASATLHDEQSMLTKSAASLNVHNSNAVEAERVVMGLRLNVMHLSKAIDAQRQALGGRLVDDKFFVRGHEVSHLTAPWVPDSLHRKREELFIAALAVHKAFIDVSAKKVLHNLSILMSTFNGTSLEEAKRKFLGDLWSTLFLVVPVVSSAFASIERMLGDMTTGSIGWLLIDEAGQALPQAAVGAIMRAKRVVVVGDPLQIPPVMTLPLRLNSEICRFFKVDPMIWSAPEASAQTLADRTSKFQASFRSEQGPRRVGVPLLVHRRCQEPMFGISNRIAYDGQMVHAAGARNAGRIAAVLGPSQWFNLAGEADSNWCPAEGEHVVALMKQIAAAGILDPDLFIITPFKTVAAELKKRLLREEQLFSTMRVDVRDWAKNRVGTIHTVQGREADTVFLVLGAPNEPQNGARSWATGTPNILNVAVSRAKQNLYVVGSYGAWAGVGYGRELASMPHVRIGVQTSNYVAPTQTSPQILRPQ